MINGWIALLFGGAGGSGASGTPTLTFQVAFTSNPTDETLTWTTVPGTRDISYQRGVPNEYGQAETGESTVLLGDAVSDLDPSNPASDYYPNVRPMRAMRAFLTVGAVDYPLFQHFIERLPRSADVAGVWTERTLTGVDGFAWFALAGLKGQSFPEETSGARWGRVLDAVSWPAARRNLDTGDSTLDAVTFDNNADTKALQHLLDVVASENGFGFLDAAGNARLISRHALITDSPVVLTLVDGKAEATGDYPGALTYVDLQPESTDVANDYSGRRGTDGTVMTARDTASVAAYGPRSQELTSLVNSDSEVQDALDWKLAQTKEPDERIDSVVVMPGRDSAAWVALLTLEVGDRVLVVEQPPGYAAPVERDYLVRHLAVSLPTALAAAQFTFQLTPAASQDAWLVLNDGARGLLDTGRLAY